MDVMTRAIIICCSTSSANVPLPVSLVETSEVSEQFKCEILSHFRNDAVERICQNDSSIVLVAERLMMIKIGMQGTCAH